MQSFEWGESSRARLSKCVQHQGGPREATRHIHSVNCLGGLSCSNNASIHSPPRQAVGLMMENSGGLAAAARGTPISQRASADHGALHVSVQRAYRVSQPNADRSFW